MSRLAVLSLGLLLGAVSVALSAPAPETPKIPKELLEQRLKAAKDAYKEHLFVLRNGGGSSSVRDVTEWARRVLEAEKALSNKKEDRLRNLENHWAEMKEIERITEVYAKTGQLANRDAKAARYHRIEAEIWIIEAGGKVPKWEEPKGELSEAIIEEVPPAKKPAKKK